MTFLFNWKKINTVLEDGSTIADVGWYSMSCVEPEIVAGFKEYGTKLDTGGGVNTSQRKGHILSQNDAQGVNIKNYLNNWTSYM